MHVMHLARRPRALAVAFAALGIMALAPASAQAVFGVGTSVEFAPTFTVGGPAQPGSIELANLNDLMTGTNTVCNAGDPGPPCQIVPPERGITLTPSCGQTNSGQCSVGSEDPGVFVLTPGSAVGRAGTQCAGVAFTTSIIDAATGRVRFAPPAGTHISLAAGTSCIIDFMVSAVKSPTLDQDPATAGIQTAQATSHRQYQGTTVPPPPGAPNGQAAISAFRSPTILRAQPVITTIASADIPLGGQLTDQATVQNLVSPVAGATVTFRLYPPADTVCAGTPVFVDSRPATLSGTTATATSGAYTPTAAGVYHWIATYNGDANNLPISGICGEATETRTVTGPPPPPAPPPPPPAKPPTTPVVCTTPPGPAPAGGVLCARGTAAIRGRTGCQGSAFNVVVSGRQVQRVVFSLDGRVVRSLTRPNSGSRFVLKVNPRTLRSGVHRVVARTTFRSRSGTPARVLRVTFSKCARRAQAPAFTG